MSEPAIIAGMAAATLPTSPTPWQHYVDNYDNIRDKMAEVLDGFEDFNRQVRTRFGLLVGSVILTASSGSDDPARAHMQSLRAIREAHLLPALHITQVDDVAAATRSRDARVVIADNVQTCSCPIGQPLTAYES
jgi:hypothetical protein